MTESGGVSGLLYIHAEFNHVQQYLYLSLRLERSSHDPEGHNRLPVAHHETGNDGMEGALAGSVHVRVLRVEGELGPPALQRKTEAVRGHAAAELEEVALDERYHVSVRIRNGQVDGIPVFEIAGRDALHRLRHVDAPALFGGVFFRKQAFERDVHEGRIGVMPGAVREGEFFRFHKDMEVIGGIMSQRREVEAFEDTEHLQHRDPLSVRGQFIHLHIPVGNGYRVYPGARVRLEIGFPKRRVRAAGPCVDGVRNGALVEYVASLCGNPFVRSGKIGIVENFTFGRHVPIHEIGIFEAAEIADFVDMIL